MEDVTDTVFREIAQNISNPEILKIVFTEFTSVDGLMDYRGYKSASERLYVNKTELSLLRANKVKLVAQIWGNDPEKFSRAAELITRMGHFDGIDINMGCPVKKVIKKNTCSALIQVPELAKKIITATQAGTHLPVSVKTRTGFNTVVTDEWIKHLLEANPSAITLHGRTKKMLSGNKADWNEIKKAVDLRNKLNPDTILSGNGDVVSFHEGVSKSVSSGAEGIMVGRGVFHNPWIFNDVPPEISNVERMDILEKHIRLYEKTWSGTKSIKLLKRFIKIYINSFNGAADFRARLMRINSYDKLYEAISKEKERTEA